MKFIDEYRNRELVLSASERLKTISERDIVIMEVCGGHTMAIHRFGLDSLMPAKIHLLSGPGCPVCVSGQRFIDLAIQYSGIPDLIVTTYGDLIRVPGSNSTLEKERANGSDIRVIYSVLESLEIAKQNRNKKVVFLGIGFETTAPSTAAAILEAAREKVPNFFVLSSHKVMPPVMKALAEDGLKIDGFIAPGHVSTITGTSIYMELASSYGLGVVVSGFEPLDIMQSILMLTTQINSRRPAVEVQYSRAVSKDGNRIARKFMDEVFELRDDIWRGIGVIKQSGLALKETYSRFDAERNFNVEVPESKEPEGCICGKILKGLKKPADCPLFADKCTPENPAGACMVSTEGTCSAYYRYRQ